MSLNSSRPLTELYIHRRSRVAFGLGASNGLLNRQRHSCLWAEIWFVVTKCVPMKSSDDPESIRTFAGTLLIGIVVVMGVGFPSISLSLTAIVGTVTFGLLETTSL